MQETLRPIHINATPGAAGGWWHTRSLNELSPPLKAALLCWCAVGLVVVDMVDGLLGSSVALGLLLQPWLLGEAVRVRRAHDALELQATPEQVDLATVRAELRRDEETLHEVRTTVAGIALAAQLLDQQRDELPAEALDRLRRMQQAEIARLERLVTPTDLRRPLATDGDQRRVVAVDEVLEPLVVARRARGEDVRWSPSGVALAASEDHLAEIVHTLLENAARHAPGAVVHVTVEATADEVRVRVRDEGGGLPHAVRHRVFEWGARGPGSSGSGIGLAAAHERATEAGGTLAVEETGPAGTTFLLRLPAVRS